MINGEGICEESTQIASPDLVEGFLPWQGEKSDGETSPVSSQYSSCGESEFERYCSANSVMGTPSMCSSIGTFQECLDSEFGSGRSFVLDSGSENFSLTGRFDRKLEDRGLSSSGELVCSESLDRNNNLELRNDEQSGQGSAGIKNGLNFYGDDDMESFSLHAVNLNHADGDSVMPFMVGRGTELPLVADLSTALDEGLRDEAGVMPRRKQSESQRLQSSSVSLSTQENTNVDATEANMLSFGVTNDSHSSAGVEEEAQSQMVTEHIDSYLYGLKSHSGMENDRTEYGRCSDEDNTSSRHVHSEGEDSMFGCGTDDEQKIHSYHWENMPSHKEAKRETKNSLLMNSSVAFGSDDWDDFLQETGNTDMASIMLDKFQEKEHLNIQTGGNLSNSTSKTDVGFSDGAPEQGEVMRDISVASNQVQGADGLSECIKIVSLTPMDFPNLGETEQGEDVKDIISTSNKTEGVDKSVEYLKTCSVNGILETEQDPLSQQAPLEKGLNLMDSGLERGRPLKSIEELTRVDDSRVSESQESEKPKSQLDRLSDIKASQLYAASVEATEDKMIDFLKDPYSLPSMVGNNIKGTLNNSPASFNLFEDHSKTQNFEQNEFYDEVVHEMEEILLDSGESHGASFTHGNRIYQSPRVLPYRDGGSTASTSGSDDAYPPIQRPLRIDGVEVVGAKQKSGDVSLGERLVGVKEYTVYKIRVWSGKDHWEVDRRYRDFCTLYRRLKTLFADQGWILPSPWSSVERESRKIFGNVSPDVVAERSSLIQECLQSIIHSGFSSSPPTALIWFLSQPKAPPGSPASNTDHPQSPFSVRGTDTDNVSTLGKTISLIVEIHPHKSTKQILEAQHYTCAGCRKHFDDGKTRMLEFVQTLGWGKPRLCEYTGQLFCSSCHTNETAILPARVLHHWDFTPYLVSQLAKSYLDSIHDQNTIF
ncbi:uncharacterized protein LOC132304317 isoform X2 [Cornus florida]|uniref:uncharacterized protein LOC132304317 isoform X2 n=1 Tax=Cornus florida TaxID=4283 RepID=UPI00289EF6FC|nr:uncharacterized protein LOC132304317 isoform X2 [Cornus florida]